MGNPCNARCSDTQFIAIWHEEECSPAKVAKRLNLAPQNVHQRRVRLESRHGIVLPTIASGNAPATRGVEFTPAYPTERHLALTDGSIIVGSDAHIWPGEFTPAMRGFLAAIDIVKPLAVVSNGDWVDGARISRHPRIGWARSPTISEELEAVKLFADEVVTRAAVQNNECGFFWNMGNHCLRFDNYLSRAAPEFEGMPLMRLEDHFPRWQFQWSLPVNADLVIKHRFANGGIHGGYNATLKAGRSTCNGHTHILEIKPWGDYNGRRWGIQGGSLADLEGPQFEYHEANPSPACSGFAVLTYRDGQLMPPELAEVINGRCYFRGEVIA